MNKAQRIENFDLTQYLSNGIQNIVKNALKATLKRPKATAFLVQYAAESKIAAKKRTDAEKRGEHIPPFLIASITSSCNLHCAGCYARHSNACSDEKAIAQLSAKEWLDIFYQAKDLGVSFILLAGGEPLIRKDVLEAASTLPEIIFPIFTNGTLIDEGYLTLFECSPNLLPVFSIEGLQDATDQRRGKGVYKRLVSAMDQMNERHLLFGASITVTKENINDVVASAFLNELYQRGCKAVFFVEYVPMDNKSQALAPDEEARSFLSNTLPLLRESYPDMLFISFPGDEKTSGGCLAAGRGFFHINSHGGAEPCPFSPYSDINVKDTSLKDALRSKLFLALQQNKLLSKEHIGGCVLFEQRDKVEALLSKTNDTPTVP